MKWPAQRREAPLEGVPAARRQKNYASQSGYAYEYFHEGRRESGDGREYVFTASGDRKAWFTVSVVVPDASTGEWERLHGRPLQDNERFAVAKLALMEAFDLRETPQAMRAPVLVTPEQVEELLGRLGVE
ncbi:MAG: hypothetical protein HY858_12280 [Candidatus Solibacter usitatus]|nr:hypothetical protein [Candidatus Solibacter usitatus]